MDGNGEAVEIEDYTCDTQAEVEEMEGQEDYPFDDPADVQEMESQPVEEIVEGSFLTDAEGFVEEEQPETLAGR